MRRVSPKRTPIPTQITAGPSLIRMLMPFAATALLAVAGTLFADGAFHARAPHIGPRTPALNAASPTVAELMAMSQTQLAGVDPLVMNLSVAKGIPECAGLDVAKYVAVVDGWARAIEEVNTRDERQGRGVDLYHRNKDLWRAGGMAVTLAGPTIGVRYTGDPLDPGKPAQGFVHGVIDDRTGTCATMPVLYMAIGYRLGWPVKGVVSKDHMWARWDDGVPAEKGGQRFNLEATTAGEAGHEGEFASVPDEDYVRDLRTPRIAIESGSDMTSLTPREILGVFLQQRAGYWAAKNQWDHAESDLLLAASCFPKNREIRHFLVEAMSHTNQRYFIPREIDRLASTLAGAGYGRSQGLGASRPSPTINVDMINHENMRRLGQTLAPSGPPEGLGVP